MKKLSLFMAFLIWMLPLSVFADSPFIGEGTADAPYEIRTAVEWRTLSVAVNSGNEALAHAHYLLCSDILFYPTDTLKLWAEKAPGENLVPIGTKSHPFSGTFDGGGHTVRGFYYKDDAAEYAGLFGVLENATVRNLMLEDSYIRAHKYVGGIAGALFGNERSSVTDCYSAATVKGTSFTGGITGYISSGEHGETELSGNRNNGEIIGYNSVGGIAGGIFSRGTVILEKCMNSAQISGGNFNLGGIAGECFASGKAVISHSYSTGTVRTGSDEYHHGGVIGYLYGKNEQSTATAFCCRYLDTADKSGVGRIGSYASASDIEPRSSMLLESKDAFQGFDFLHAWSFFESRIPVPDAEEKMRHGAITVTVDERNAVLSPSPEIRDDRAFLPVRSLMERLGATVSWDAESRTVTVTGERTLIFTIDSLVYSVDGDEKKADTPPYIQNGRTMLPLRTVAEALGKTVLWKDAPRQIILN